MLKKFYGQKQAGRAWNHHLNDALKPISFKQSDIDKSVWYRDKTIFFCYVNDIIFVGPESKSINTMIEKIMKAGLDTENKVNIEY